MNVADIHGKKPLAVKSSVADSPHLTIETNLTCNIKCRSCYNINNSFVKEFDRIIQEIDTGINKRNLQAITIIGGEPTLHPRLPDIIRYIKSKGITCQLLTNGKRFLDDPEDVFLDSLIEAGLDKILLHVDEGQREIHSDLDRVTRSLFNKFEERKVYYSLSNTIFFDTQGLLSGKIRKYASYKYFDGILALLSRDCNESIKKKSSQKDWSQLKIEYQELGKDLMIDPVGYIPTSLSDDDISWLFFFYYINANTGETFSRSPQLLSLFSKIYYFFKKKNAFALNFNPWQFYLVFIFSSLIEVLIQPARVKRLFRLLKRSGFLRALRIHTIVIQNPPQYNDQREQIQFCYHCPDATIRNGKLTPLCLADMINPLAGVHENIDVPEDLYNLVYEHMNELN